ncbi:hypothetical protein [Nocardioides alcanivorans]|uniref:hypothetical protein n=1 Tax=Nocardioides alcanivorans TaxID=2897352 RepID=UPI001F2AC1B8|nr:hypothetical protein [Nocardioides alcanivorans]
MSDSWEGMPLWERVAETMRATRGALDSDVDNVLDVFADWLWSDEVREVVAEAIVAYEDERWPCVTVDEYAKTALDALVARVMGEGS